MSSPLKRSWDIFCTIVDNLGDAGFCWRLARQLVVEYGLEVRLWVDDLACFSRFASEVDANLAQQWVQGVEICSWQKPFKESKPANVVIEAFACNLPAPYIDAMAAIQPPPVWLNLEYLSAENWIKDYHLLPSFHPHLPLTKYFFFPGFTPGTGGLLQEKYLLSTRSSFNNDTETVFWKQLGIEQRKKGELRVSLFCYDRAPIHELLSAWIVSDVPVCLFVPEGSVVDMVADYFKIDSIKIGEKLKVGQLKVCFIPFLEQDKYDQLLWSCDINFVRGEDSFVRAQWAAKPFVWNIYPQAEQSHRIKLDAFLNLYTSSMTSDMSAAVFSLWNVWNSREKIKNIWPMYVAQLTALTQHSEKWIKQLNSTGDLVSNLVQFSRKDRI